MLKALGALTVASVGVGIMWGGGPGVAIGGFVLINAFLVLGALAWR
jgi:hypothetical protein